MSVVNVPLVAASGLLLLTAVVHSGLGEVLIFRKLREGGVVPTRAAPPLQSRNVRILWASWHLVSVFGLVLTAAVYRSGIGQAVTGPWLLRAIAIACFTGGALVLLGTRGRHPGWIALSAAAILVLDGLGSS